MNRDQPELKTPAKVSLAAIAALLVIAIIFFKERALFADAAYTIFNVLNEHSINLSNQRYGAFITKLVPYLGQNLHFPIKYILFGYAVVGNVFLLIVTALFVYVFKQYKFAILLALFSLLIVSDSFFMLADIYTGISWMFLFFAVTIHLERKRVSMALLSLPFILLGYLAITTHFIIIIPTIFLWVYFILDKDAWPFRTKQSIFLSALLVAVIAGKMRITADKSYDSSHLHGVTHFSIKDVIKAFTKPTVTIFLYRCIVNYWAAVIVFISGIVYLAKERKIQLLVWTVISVMGYIVLMGLSYGDMDANTLLCHIELEWECLGLIVATPFVFVVLPKIKTSTASLLLACIFIIRLVYILSFSPAYSLRTKMEEDILSRMRKKEITKLALYNDPHLMSVARIYWALPYETTIASAINGDKPQLTFFFVNPDDKKAIEEIKDPKGFYNVWFMTPCNILNKEYFNIDSTQRYQVMTYAEFLK